jgi:hypothetical protein
MKMQMDRCCEMLRDYSGGDGAGDGEAGARRGAGGGTERRANARGTEDIEAAECIYMHPHIAEDVPQLRSDDCMPVHFLFASSRFCASCCTGGCLDFDHAPYPNAASVKACAATRPRMRFCWRARLVEPIPAIPVTRKATVAIMPERRSRERAQTGRRRGGQRMQRCKERTLATTLLHTLRRDRRRISCIPQRMRCRFLLARAHSPSGIIGSALHFWYIFPVNDVCGNGYISLSSSPNVCVP